jgi:hypothetical protein
VKTTNILEKVKKIDNVNKKSSDRMEAIARGVQARFEERTGYLKKITDETVNIARFLGVPNNEIEKWIYNRQNRLAEDTGKILEIKSLLSKV